MSPRKSTGIFGNDYLAELTAEGLSEEEAMERVVARDIELSKETEDIRHMVYAVDTESGEMLWEEEATPLRAHPGHTTAKCSFSAKTVTHS